MERTRDNQRQKVYDAEGAVFDWSTDPVVGKTVAEVQQWVDRLEDYAWFRRRWGSRRLKVYAQRGGGGESFPGRAELYVGMNASRDRPGARQRVVVHEMAHCLAEYGDRHGSSFTRTMLELVRYVYGYEEERNLRQAYKEQRAKVGSPTKIRATVPPPRPVKHAYRVQIGDDEPIVLESVSLVGAMDILTSVSGVHRQTLKTSNPTRITIWKSVRRASATQR